MTHGPGTEPIGRNSGLPVRHHLGKPEAWSTTSPSASSFYTAEQVAAGPTLTSLIHGAGMAWRGRNEADPSKATRMSTYQYRQAVAGVVPNISFQSTSCPVSVERLNACRNADTPIRLTARVPISPTVLRRSEASRS